MIWLALIGSLVIGLVAGIGIGFVWGAWTADTLLTQERNLTRMARKVDP